MSIDTNKRVVEVTVNGVDMVVGIPVKQQNIEIMKSIDTLNAISSGGQIASDEIYEAAHKELQIYMNKTMNGEVYDG